MVKEREKKKESTEGFVRLLDTDIPAEKPVIAGLTRIKGIGFSLANAVCNYFNIDKTKRLSQLSEDEIKKINSLPDVIKNFPPWLLNRQKDRVSGENLHLFTTKLDLAKEFDIRRMKKIKSYKGIRHSMGLPVRGQRTKSHFRTGAAVGVEKAKSKKR
ncbi:MAG: 30S ribosomal protein S13 [Candidatus Pacearchaeota archaeon]